MRTDAGIKAERSADTLALDIVIAILHFLGIDEVAVFLPSIGFDVVALELALVVGQATGDAEIVGELGGEIEADIRGQLARIVVVAAADLADIEILLAIEGAGCLDLDRGADGVGVHVRGQRLLHFDRFDDVGGNHVKRHAALVDPRRRHAHTVQ